MRRARHAIVGIVLAVVVAVSLGAAAPPGAASPGTAASSATAPLTGPQAVDAAAGAVLVVDDDGSAQFSTISDAVAAASDGDTIRVRPGTYRETVRVTQDVTLVAPDGATLNGSTLEESTTALLVGENASVVVDGLTVTHYQMGVDAAGAREPWVVRNVTVAETSYKGIRAAWSEGDWTIENVTVRNTSTGIDATSSTGDWTVRDTVVRSASGGSAFEMSPSAGNWTLRNVTVVEADLVGVAASYSTGDWRVANSTIRGTSVGVGALEATGDWTISRTTVANASAEHPYDIMMPPLREGVGVHAARTNGSWTIHHSRFVGNGVAAVDASDAAPAGDATRNWWGSESGPDGNDCVGNVDCGDAAATWPPEARSTTRTATTATAGLTTHRTRTSTKPTTASNPASSTVGTENWTTTSTETSPTPLSPVLAVLGVVSATLALARRHRRD